MRHDLPALKLLWAFALGAAGCTASLPFDDLSSGSSAQDPFDKVDIPAPSDFECEAFEGEELVALCDDFDDDDRPLEDVWSSVEVIPSGNGAMETKMDGDGSRSRPNHLFASIGGSYEQDTMGNWPYAASLVRHDFTNLQDKPFIARITFEMRVDAFDPLEKTRVSAAQFLFGDLANLNQMVLNLESRGSTVSAQFTENTSKGGFNAGRFKAIQLDTWLEVEMELEINEPEGDDNYVTVTLENETLFEGKLSYDLFGLEPRFELGVPWVDTMLASAPWELRYDNVLVLVKELED
jgi:hypothetical protein